MKSSEIEVGGLYLTKVGVRTVEVKIVRQNPKGGFDATSVASGKPIRIKDAARLKPAKAAPEQEPQDDQSADAPEDPPQAKAPAKGAKQRATQPPRAAKKAEAGPRPLSCLDAAAAVLKAEGKPMQCKGMVEQMAAKGLGSSSAPTPAATLYSAILRELARKGDASRFRKTDRGHFALNA